MNCPEPLIAAVVRMSGHQNQAAAGTLGLLSLDAAPTGPGVTAPCASSFS
jgi:hypothetical protein